MPRLPFKSTQSAPGAQRVSDRQLIVACLKGDQAAWNTLIDRYAALIYSTCLRAGLAGADAEDVVQDVCVILVDHLADVRDDARLSSWLISTTRREAWRLRRRNGLALASEIGDEDWSLDGGESLFGHAGDSPERELIALEEEQMVRRGLELLPDRCRKLLSRLYGTDNAPSYVEIAAELEIAVGSVGPTRARCLEQLRKLLGDLGY
ncbi:MAG TPA: sigma-70 family RNA polymerase sigma factor [Chthonomonadaceae bacterium]|nr:sigma-70 family RNA polymerase sigma factor [Chthonomonadaceae bacterium]